MFDLIKARVDMLKSNERNGASLSPIDFELIELYESRSNYDRANYLLKRVLEMEGDLLQTNLGGAIREYFEET